jgi:hypothetical protein
MVAARLQWLHTAANIFDLIYSGDRDGTALTATGEH